MEEIIIQPRHILLYIGPGRDIAIGENFIKLPFLINLRKAFPDASITWIHGNEPSMFMGLLAPLAKGLIDEVLFDRDLGEGIGCMTPWHRALPGREFDLIIDTQKNPRRTLILRRIKHKVLISPTWRYFFSDKKPPKAYNKPKALTDKLLALAFAATGNIVLPDHRLPIPDEVHYGARLLLPEGPTYVGFAPGAGLQITGKCWPLERFVAAARKQDEENRIPVFITGPQERELEAKIREAIPEALFPLADLSKLDGILTDSLRGPVLTMAIGNLLSVSVANCSGTGHMLAAGGSPMISLFGPTNPDKFAPFTPDITIIKAQEYGDDNIESIPTSRVIEAIESRLHS